MPNFKPVVAFDIPGRNGLTSREPYQNSSDEQVPEETASSGRGEQRVPSYLRDRHLVLLDVFDRENTEERV